MTGLIGDPTGRNVTRPPMTREEIDANAETYRTQVFKILDPEKTEVRFNSAWLEKMQYLDLVRLCSKYTVARLLERDDFSKRFKEGVPILMHELLYPLAQGYDSVALACDVEMGGTDQKFNLLVGRELQRDFGQSAQIVATVPLLEGLDGVEKMSKSKGNYIGITEAPKVMFRKVMQISDELMYRYYELLTDMPVREIDLLRGSVKDGARDPMELKMELGKRIVADFHSHAEADEAYEAFNREVRQGLEPADTETVALPPEVRTDKGVRVDKLIARIGLVGSVSEATRKVKEGAVEINGERVNELTIPAAAEMIVIRVGKKWKRVRPQMPD
jgi:tyrosyl-tRNA synthetase